MMRRLPSRLTFDVLRLILLVCLIALAAGIVVVDRYGLVDRAQPADVIVVLGSRVEADGQPAPALARRAAHAAALYRQRLAPAVLCSGGVTTGPVSEAAAACGRVAALGVPPQATVLEERATSTEENALYAAAEMRRRGWRTAILVSDGFHLYRAAWLFERAGVTVYPSPAQVTTGPMSPVERWVRAAREVLALLWTQVKWAIVGGPQTVGAGQNGTQRHKPEAPAPAGGGLRNPVLRS